jgi:hypothetical protein
MHKILECFNMCFEMQLLRQQLAAISEDAETARSMGDPELALYVLAENSSWIDSFQERAESAGCIGRA